MVAIFCYAVTLMLPWNMFAVSPCIDDGTRLSVVASPPIMLADESKCVEPGPSSSSRHGCQWRMPNAERRFVRYGCEEAILAGSPISGGLSSMSSQSMSDIATNADSVIQSSVASILNSGRVNSCPVPS